MLGWEFPPRITGGLGMACRGLARGLGAIGVRVLFVLPRVTGEERGGRGVEVVGADADGGEDAGAASGTGSGGAAGDRARGAPLRAYDGAGVPPRAPRDGAAPPATPALPREVAAYAAAVLRRTAGEPFDLVHGHDWMTYPAAEAVARARGVPLVLHVHSTEVDRAGPRAHPAIRAVEQRGFDVADRIVCVSGFTARRLVRDYDVDPARVHVVHNAVLHEGEPSPRRRRRHLREPVVLFLGRVTFQKGPAFFLEAAALVARRHATVRFLVAGDGDLLPWMIERAAALGLARRVHFAGFVTGVDRERAFAAADVFVMPSVAEPFGIAALEAMARGVPVVLSRQSGAAEVLVNVLRADYWDVETQARSILSVLRDARLRRRLAARGRAEAGRWRWERQARRLVGVYAGTLPVAEPPEARR